MPPFIERDDLAALVRMSAFGYRDALLWSWAR